MKKKGEIFQEYILYDKHNMNWFRKYKSTLQVARWEYRTQGLSKTFKSRHIGCFFLGVCIFLLGIFRDKRYKTVEQIMRKFTFCFEQV